LQRGYEICYDSYNKSCTDADAEYVLKPERGELLNIKEVAKAAGVSVATISRVLNHPEQVQPETKNHVLEIMQQLNYQPNWFARGLNIGKTGTIALLIPSIEDHGFLDVVAGVETIARRKEHTVLLCNTHGDAQEELNCLKMVLTRQVDGIILVASRLDSDTIQSLLKEDYPWVHVGSRAPANCRNVCYIDYKKGARRMTKHLLKLGHQNITLLLDRAPFSESDAIAAGYQEALQEHGLSCDQTILQAESSVQGGYLIAQKLLQSGAMPPVLITASDDQAFGVTKAAMDKQIEIPGALALACLKDSPVTSILNPPLTALELPSHRLGLMAARMLFDCIESSDTEHAPQEVILEPTVKVRRSCGNTNPVYEMFG